MFTTVLNFVGIIQSAMLKTGGKLPEWSFAPLHIIRTAKAIHCHPPLKFNHVSVSESVWISPWINLINQNCLNHQWTSRWTICPWFCAWKQKIPQYITIFWQLLVEFCLCCSRDVMIFFRFVINSSSETIRTKVVFGRWSQSGHVWKTILDALIRVKVCRKSLHIQRPLSNFLSAFYTNKHLFSKKIMTNCYNINI